MASSSEAPSLNRPRHVKYWLRCLKTFLPNLYLSMDSNRTLLATFTLSALDLLSELDGNISGEERASYVSWIYSCQLPTGGFRGSPTHSFESHRNEQNAKWDPANIPATSFAIAALFILGDDLSQLKRRECLEWLRRTQREDGGFVEVLDENGKATGKSDPRLAYCATQIRWLLAGGMIGDVEDIRIDDLVRWIHTLETYDGGFSDIPFCEAHAGFTHCIVSTLSLIDRLPDEIENPLPLPHKQLGTEAQQPRTSQSLLGLLNLPLTLSWLAARQTSYLDEDEPPADFLNLSSLAQGSPMGSAESQSEIRSALVDPDNAQAHLSSMAHSELSAGFNGRTNKIADSCYAFWVYGTFHSLSKMSIPSMPAAKRYLLQDTQHMIGGFGKVPGHPPDVYHSYLVLATLALMGQDGLKKLDPCLCLSEDVRGQVLEHWRRIL